MEFLFFIFSGFWVWLGFMILLVMIGSVAAVVAVLVKACKRNRKVTAYRIGERWHIQVENASKEDTVTAMHALGDSADVEGDDDE